MNYKELMSANVKRNISELIRRGVVERSGHKYLVNVNNSPENLWLKYYAEKDSRQCPLWEFYFNFYNIIPEGCRNCWKIVMTMTTLEQLMQIKELQEHMELSSKCGAETRGFTGKIGTYGAYWYSDLYGGLKKARLLFDKIVDNVTPLMKACGGTWDIILKRGCTEMERKFGDSSQWNKGAKVWDNQEKLLDSVFELGKVEHSQHPIDRIDILAQLYEYAYEHGDESYKKFAQQDFGLKITKYHTGAYNFDDFICTLKGGSDDRGRLEIL